MNEPFISKGKWFYRVVRDDGAHKTFTSVKPGLAGKKAVLKKGRDFIEGGLNRSNKTVKDFWPAFLAYYKKKTGKLGQNIQFFTIFTQILPIFHQIG